MNMNRFFVAGINYKKTEVELRGLFAINYEQYAAVLNVASTLNIEEIFILSTCNRTEIYGLVDDANLLIELLCMQTTGDIETFKKSAYIKNGADAIEHLFNVGAGLDSQILGDYEIVGQLKAAAKFAKQKGFIKGFSERLINAVLQVSKLIKTNTQLSGGTVSVSFAAIQYIRNYFKNIKDKNILLVGAGKIGSSTCKNLVDYLHTKNITLINRSPEKAIELAKEFDLRATDISKLDNEVAAADIILVATNAEMPVVLKSQLENNGEKFIVDLSIPCNVEESVHELSNVHLVNVDELSKLKDKTLKKREAEIPKAKALIGEAMKEFFEWHEMRRHAPVLKDLKYRLQKIHNSPSLQNNAVYCEAVDIKIQKLVNETAGKMKTINQKGCQFISAINEFIGTA
jgi:glutamyl-tRNA reductase